MNNPIHDYKNWDNKVFEQTEATPVTGYTITGAGGESKSGKLFPKAFPAKTVTMVPSEVQNKETNQMEQNNDVLWVTIDDNKVLHTSVSNPKDTKISEKGTAIWSSLSKNEKRAILGMIIDNSNAPQAGPLAISSGLFSDIVKAGQDVNAGELAKQVYNGEKSFAGMTVSKLS